MTRSATALAVMVLAIATPALADDTWGGDHSAAHIWAETQHNLRGDWCCKISDGHFLDDTQWRQVEPKTTAYSGYQVLIMGQWYDVPAYALRDPHKGGPNPFHKPIVWYSVNWPTVQIIYCFAPGFQG